MFFLLPCFKPAYFCLVMPVQFIALYAEITTDVRDRIDPCIDRYLLKNPTILG